MSSVTHSYSTSIMIQNWIHQLICSIIPKTSTVAKANMSRVHTKVVCLFRVNSILSQLTGPGVVRVLTYHWLEYHLLIFNLPENKKMVLKHAQMLGPNFRNLANFLGLDCILGILSHVSNFWKLEHIIFLPRILVSKLFPSTPGLLEQLQSFHSSSRSHSS